MDTYILCVRVPYLYFASVCLALHLSSSLPCYLSSSLFFFLCLFVSFPSSHLSLSVISSLLICFFLVFTSLSRCVCFSVLASSFIPVSTCVSVASYLPVCGFLFLCLFLPIDVRSVVSVSICLSVVSVCMSVCTVSMLFSPCITLYIRFLPSHRFLFIVYFLSVSLSTHSNICPLLYLFLYFCISVSDLPVFLYVIRRVYLIFRPQHLFLSTSIC